MHLEFFADTANVEEIAGLTEAGLIQGVTTNPTLIQRAGRIDFDKCIKEICDIVQGPVSAEVVSTKCDSMVRDGRHLSTIDENVVVKLPCDPQGMKACRILSKQGIHINMTLAFSVAQYALAANAGATYVSPFIGRLDDIGVSGIDLIADIAEYKRTRVTGPYILAASIRNVDHVNEAAIAGADIVTIPPKIIWDCMKHDLTIKGIKRFQEDWQKLQEVV